MAQSDDREGEPELFNEPVSADAESGGNQHRCAEKAFEGLLDDHQLLNAYAEGDEQAFETLVEKYFRMVYTVAARQTGDSHLAEEITQSVFLILSRKARGFSSKTPVPAWLLRTTRFVSWDAIKMRRRREQKERNFAVNLEQPVAIKTEPSGVEVLL